MSSPLLSELPKALVRIATGQSLLFDSGRFGSSAAVEIIEGFGRLSCSCDQGEAMTIAFLQTDVCWLCQRTCAQAVCLEGLTPC